MGIRGRLRRAEQRADKDMTVLTCSGMWGEGANGRDVALKLLRASWQEAVREEYTPDPEIARVLAHPHEELAASALRDFPGVVDEG